MNIDKFNIACFLGSSKDPRQDSSEWMFGHSV
jgi:hypothetical protein